jgi:hypothetical protein
LKETAGRRTPSAGPRSATPELATPLNTLIDEVAKRAYRTYYRTRTIDRADEERMAIYLTQLIYINPGKEAIFDTFESVALPLLSKYRGELLLRIRPNPESVIQAESEIPYEIHIVRFENEEDLKEFSEDTERKRVLHLKNQSVRDSLLIRGTTSG